MFRARRSNNGGGLRNAVYYGASKERSSHSTSLALYCNITSPHHRIKNGLEEATSDNASFPIPIVLAFAVAFAVAFARPFASSFGARPFTFACAIEVAVQEPIKKPQSVGFVLVARLAVAEPATESAR